jgi:type II secretory pathway pseudopilin PulG
MKIGASRVASANRLAVVLLLLATASILPVRAKAGIESWAMQQARIIAVALSQYAQDHGGRYPQGNSSTEVFQKILDGNYLDNSDFFYVPLEGKTKGRLGARLKPENVSFDVTGGGGLDSPKDFPLVFLTGYRVDYRPGGSAVSLTDPFPRYGERTWWGWLNGEHFENMGPLLAVGYVNTYAYLRPLDTSGAHGFVPHFIPRDFNPHGKAYRQLTPEGVFK